MDKKCENCNNEHNGEYGSGRFCSIKCARGFSTKIKRKEINQKISEKFTGSGNEDIKKKCINCKEKFITPWSRRSKIFCCVSCASKFRMNTPKMKKWAANNAKKNKLGGNRNNKAYGMNRILLVKFI